MHTFLRSKKHFQGKLFAQPETMLSKKFLPQLIKISFELFSLADSSGDGTSFCRDEPKEEDQRQRRAEEYTGQKSGTTGNEGVRGKRKKDTNGTEIAPEAG